MKEEIKQAFNQTILEKSLSYYNATLNNIIKDCKGFESHVYEFQLKDKNYILKITHSLHRKKENIIGEIEWTKYLIENGLKVNELFNSKNGNWLETIESEKPDQYFVITAYEKMKGSFLNKENINTEKTKNLGKTIGKIHKISKKFKPSKNLYKRNDWSNDHILDFEKFYPKSDKKIMIKAYEKLKLIKQIPINKEGYGLIHNDLHNNNYFVNNESILIFDFDDSVYNWYINDLAINIFYSKRVIEKENLNIYLKNLFSGYWQENDLEKSWLNYIPDFIELRDFILYSVINENINRKNPEKSDIEILELIRKRIINGNNLSEVDYSKYVN